MGTKIADEIISCMRDARHPSAGEVQAVAARIWADIQIGGPSMRWSDLTPGCRQHRQMIAAARAALGASGS
jgi:hypothetical protein